MSSYKKTWSTDAQIAADSYFIYKQEFMTILRTMKKNWAIVELRQQCFDIWSNMRREFPVGVDKQFPEFKFYINTENSEYPKLEAQMLAALSYKESSKHRNEPESDKAGTISKRDLADLKGGVLKFDSEDDAKKSYYEALHGFETLASRVNSGYDRKSFETKYSLKWEA
jgi:hypothetical protein